MRALSAVMATPMAWISTSLVKMSAARLKRQPASIALFTRRRLGSSSAASAFRASSRRLPGALRPCSELCEVAGNVLNEFCKVRYMTFNVTLWVWHGLYKSPSFHRTCSRYHNYRLPSALGRQTPYDHNVHRETYASSYIGG